VLLTVKYAEVAWRYPEGGGVVNVASRALHPFAGLLGGCFIVVDYYLTVVHLAAGHEGRRARATGSACSRPSW